MKISRPFLFFAWSLGVLALGLGLAVQIKKGLHWETDVLALLPVTEQDPVVEQALRTFSDRIGQKNVFLVGHPNREQAQDASDRFAAALEASSAFENVIYRTDEGSESAFFDLYFPHRYTLLGSDTRALLNQADGGQTLVRRAKETLYGPMTAAVSGLLEDDPLLLFPGFLRSFPKPPGTLQVEEGRMMVHQEGRYFIFLSADLVGSAFNAGVQDLAVGQLDAMIDPLQADDQELEILSTGVLRYAHAGTQSAKGEISTIGVGSLIGVILLLLITFRSIRPLLMSILPIAVGCLTAITLTFFIFGQIHVLTLVFGASLIGVCIDYSFHFFCESYLTPHGRNPDKAMAMILPAISLGALTSILGYLGLLFAPFPGLKQMAVFSSLGLLGAFATVLCWFPSLARLGPQIQAQRHPPLLRWVVSYLFFWRRLSRKTVFGVLLVVGLLVGWRFLQMKPNDDIRLLQNQPMALVTQERQIRDWIGGLDTSRFLLVEGENIETMLQNSEAIQWQLKRVKADGTLGYFQGLSQWVPSRAVQLENQKVLQQSLLDENKLLAGYLDEMGFDPKLLEEISASLTNTTPAILDLQEWLASAASIPFRHLWLGETERGVASMILLAEVGDEDQFEQMAESYPGVSYINKVDDVSNLFARYRHLASKLVMGAYGLILLLLMARYGVKRGFLAMLPPLIAAGFALAMASVLGFPVNLFSMLALLLVLGIGIDYTIFLAESKDESATTMVAIVLSSVTTILSFGLLALSATPVLRSFGLTLLIGIAAAMLLAPLVKMVQSGKDPQEMGSA